MAKAENSNDQAEEQVAQDVVAAKTRRKKLILLAGSMLVLVVISVGTTLFLVKLFSEPTATEQTSTEASSSPAVEPPKKPAIYFPLQPVFVVNFNANGRQRFMQVELNLMLRDQDVIPAIELHMPAIRNNLVMLFSGQIYEDLQTAEGKELLRQEATLSVQDTLQREIGKPGIEQVLFTNFVMQ